VPASDANFAYLSSGTWSLMGIETPAPIITDESCRLNFTNEGGVAGTTRFLKNITGMWLLEQCRKVWENEGRNYSYPQMVEMAEKSTFAGIVNPDDPAFAAPKNMPDAISKYLTDRGEATPQGDGDYIRCIYHSLAHRYREVLDMLQGFAPFRIEKLHIIGGGSANDYLNQLTADITGKTVVAGPVEATAIGNLLIQAKAAGLLVDRWQMRRIISESFRVREFNPSKAI